VSKSNRGDGGRGDKMPEFRPGTWLQGNGPESDIAICTRARLARNLQGFHFSPCLPDDEARELYDFIVQRLKQSGMPEQLHLLDLDNIDDLERTVLVERHLISRELAGSKRARGVATDTEEAVAIMINEEDHLRVQVFASGLQTEAVWRRAERLDDALIQRLPMAWSEEFGFLTSCPTNTGTGLRLSVMLHLPGLVWSDEIEKATNTAQKIHLAVRGLYGEGSRALGDFYQVSNQVTLGRDETQIQSDVFLAVGRIVQWEREVRQALLRGTARSRTLDRIYRAWAPSNGPRSSAARRPWVASPPCDSASKRTCCPDSRSPTSTAPCCSPNPGTCSVSRANGSSPTNGTSAGPTCCAKCSAAAADGWFRALVTTPDPVAGPDSRSHVQKIVQPEAIWAPGTTLPTLARWQGPGIRQGSRKKKPRKRWRAGSSTGVNPIPLTSDLRTETATVTGVHPRCSIASPTAPRRS
jgi:protein arginine kinase